MRIGLMVEGQNDLTWERWLHIAALTERLGLASLFRSDHYFTGKRQLQSLEAWLSFAAIAREPHSYRFGALVTPITFRQPVNDARMAAQIDLLSGGRFVMGLGAGWNEAEHRAYGIPFPATRERFDRLDEAVRLMRALWTERPASFEGRFYRLEEAGYQSQPEPGRPPLLIGGAGERRTLRIAAEHADEWNCVTVTEPEGYAHKVEVLEAALRGRGPRPGDDLSLDDGVPHRRAERACPQGGDIEDDGALRPRPRRIAAGDAGAHGRARHHERHHRRGGREAGEAGRAGAGGDGPAAHGLRLG